MSPAVPQPLREPWQTKPKLASSPPRLSPPPRSPALRPASPRLTSTRNLGPSPRRRRVRCCAPPTTPATSSAHPPPARVRADVLQNLQYFFGAPVSPEVTGYRRALGSGGPPRTPRHAHPNPLTRDRNSKITRSITCARLPSNIARAYHALTGFVLLLAGHDLPLPGRLCAPLVSNRKPRT